MSGAYVLDLDVLSRYCLSHTARCKCGAELLLAEVLGHVLDCEAFDAEKRALAHQALELLRAHPEEALAHYVARYLDDLTRSGAVVKVHGENG